MKWVKYDLSIVNPWRLFPVTCTSFHFSASFGSLNSISAYPSNVSILLFRSLSPPLPLLVWGQESSAQTGPLLCLLVVLHTGHSSCGLRKILLEINKISWIPHTSGQPHSGSSVSFPTKPKATLLISRIFILLFSTPTFLRGLNSDHLMANATKAPLSHPKQVSIYSWEASPAEWFT